MNDVAQLAQHLERWQRTPFVFGSFDCAQFVCEWIDARRGTDICFRVSAKYRGLPLREVHRFNQPTALRAATEEFIGSPSASRTPKLGDIVLFRNEKGLDTLGICGDTLVYAPGPLGLSAASRALVVVLAVWPLSEIE